MAGYLFSLDNIESLKLYINNGIYATKLSKPKKRWRKHHEATFADYTTMKEGDNIYFFINRKIYGIGVLVNINNYDCKFCNYPESSLPINKKHANIKQDLLWDEGKYSVNQRWLCTFKPEPYFFKDGIDMDDVLSSNPNAFKMLRAFWKLSFIKFDDIENQAFRDTILRFNQSNLLTSNKNKTIFKTNHKISHQKIFQNKDLQSYSLNVTPILDSCKDGDSLKHEMAIEAGILNQLSNNDEHTVSIFGEWDYLTHQVIASPFKPIDYMDKMDIFGYTYITGFSPTREKYIVIEIKKDKGTEESVDQLLKYVDWVKDEYCYGNYNMIDAYLVAYEFSKGLVEYKNNVSVRKYVIGRRPPKSLEWSNLKLVSYKFNSKNKKLQFRFLG